MLTVSLVNAEQMGAGAASSLGDSPRGTMHITHVQRVQESRAMDGAVWTHLPVSTAHTIISDEAAVETDNQDRGAQRLPVHPEAAGGGY